MVETKWIKIGEVGVDSGQIMVCDPCYIASDWKDKEFKLDNEKLLDTTTNKEIPSPRALLDKGITFESIWKNGITYNKAIKKGLLKEIPYHRTHEFSYDGCCRETLSEEEGAGQLNYDMGHAGAGVATRTGYGDGVYDVLAEVIQSGDNKGRVKQIKVIFIGDDE